MNDLKENALAVLIVLLFTFWYLYTGYLLVDYLNAGIAVLGIGAGILGIIIVAVLKTMHMMRKQKY